MNREALTLAGLLEAALQLSRQERSQLALHLLLQLPQLERQQIAALAGLVPSARIPSAGRGGLSPRSRNARHYVASGWIEVKDEATQVFRFRQGKTRRTLTLQSYAEAKLARFLIDKRQAAPKTRERLLAFRCRPEETLDGLAAAGVLAMDEIEAVLRIQEMDEQLTRSCLESS